MCEREPQWLAGCMGFVWVNADSFFHCVASPFHSFANYKNGAQGAYGAHVPVTGWECAWCRGQQVKQTGTSITCFRESRHVTRYTASISRMPCVRTCFLSDRHRRQRVRKQCQFRNDDSLCSGTGACLGMRVPMRHVHRDRCMPVVDACCTVAPAQLRGICCVRHAYTIVHGRKLSTQGVEKMYHVSHKCLTLTRCRSMTVNSDVVLVCFTELVTTWR